MTISSTRQNLQKFTSPCEHRIIHLRCVDPELWYRIDLVDRGEVGHGEILQHEGSSLWRSDQLTPVILPVNFRISSGVMVYVKFDQRLTKCEARIDYSPRRSIIAYIQL